MSDPWARVRDDDRGTVLVLGVGLIAVALLALLIAVNACSAFLQRSSLLSVADAAALAGAQAIDVDAYYANGATEGTRLDPAQVQSVVTRQIRRADGASDIAVERIDTDGRTVRVRLTRPLVLPFWRTGPDDVVRVEATARLDYRPGD